MLAMVAVLMLCAVLVGVAGDASVPAIDLAGLSAMAGIQSRSLDAIFMIITWFGSLPLLLPGALLLFWKNRRSSEMPIPAFPLIALLGSTLIAHLAKLAIARPRQELFPPLMEMPVDASFPSAHAMQVTALAVAWLLGRNAPPGVPSILLVVLMVVAVAMSRIYLRVHYPSDVLFGIALAVLWVIALQRFVLRREPTALV